MIKFRYALGRGDATAFAIDIEESGHTKEN
jgi:hypothetical protein